MSDKKLSVGPNTDKFKIDMDLNPKKFRMSLPCKQVKFEYNAERQEANYNFGEKNYFRIENIDFAYAWGVCQVLESAMCAAEDHGEERVKYAVKSVLGNLLD